MVVVQNSFFYEPHHPAKELHVPQRSMFVLKGMHCLLALEMVNNVFAIVHCNVCPGLSYMPLVPPVVHTRHGSLWTRREQT
jgi:hypothetical protein